MPFTDWLLNYEVKNDLIADVIAGITLGIMNIPQGMAYAILANVPAIYGIYTSIFPAIVYCIFGPSKHVSMGTNPLTSLLTANVVTLMMMSNGAPPPEDSANRTWYSILNPSRVSSYGSSETQYTEIEIGACLTLMVGVWQVLFSLFKFGKLSWILSDVLVSGYTTGAAVHVLASQLKGIFGLDLVEPDVLFGKVFIIAIDVLKKIPDTNWASVLISAVCIIILVINDEVVKPRLARYCRFPIPMQLIVVIFGTIFSYLFEFHEKFAIDTVGNISNVSPEVMAPTINKDLFVGLLTDSIIIAVVGYCITLSMAKIYAAKFAYKVDGNQELLSEGLSNLASCFFQCIPSGASMSRTSVQVSVGGKTQLTSVVSITILFVVFYIAGQLFIYLPKPVLSAIIVVALKGMFTQGHDLPKFASRSTLDGILWIGSFLAVIIMDIDTGLVISICLSLIILLYRSIAVKVEELGEISTTGLFRKLKDFELADRKENSILLNIGGAITFANVDNILESLTRKSKRIQTTDSIFHLILDMSTVSYIDQSAAKAFTDWLKKDSDVYKKWLANCNSAVESMLLKFDLDPAAYLFPTIHDALAEVGLEFIATSSSGVNLSQATQSYDIIDEETKICPPDKFIGYGSI